MGDGLGHYGRAPAWVFFEVVGVGASSEVMVQQLFVVPGSDLGMVRVKRFFLLLA